MRVVRPNGGRFPKRFLASVVAFTVICCASTTTDAADDRSGFVHTKGTKIVDANGSELFLNGINLGNWLLWEGYLMMGDFEYRTHRQFLASLSRAFGTDARAAEFEHQWRLNYVNERTISDLKSLGINSVRVPFHYNLFWSDGRLRDAGFIYLDRLLGWCRTHHVYVLLDMHAAPGYQNPGDHSDNIDSNASQPRETVTFWDGDQHVEIAAAVWRHIAARYSNEQMLLGYDLINEPVPQHGREYELLPSFLAMRAAIRQVDANHLIVAEGSWWSSDLTKLDWTDPQVQQASGVSQKWDDNLVYELHHYGPVADTLGRERFAEKLNIPIILGECGETDHDNLRAITAWAHRSLAGCFPWSFKKLSHDRALWTIPTTDRYEELKACISNGSAASPGLYEAMIEFAQTNIVNGHASHQWHPGFYKATQGRAAEGE